MATGVLWLSPGVCAAARRDLNHTWARRLGRVTPAVATITILPTLSSLLISGMLWTDRNSFVWFWTGAVALSRAIQRCLCPAHAYIAPLRSAQRYGAHLSRCVARHVQAEVWKGLLFSGTSGRSGGGGT